MFAAELARENGDLQTVCESADTSSRFSADQTRLFSREQWVRFPFTKAQVRRDAISRTVVRGR